VPWAAAAVSAAGSIGGALIGSSASETAAKEQAAQQQQTLDWVKQNYGNTQGNLQPYIGAGQSALQSIQGFYGLPGGNASGATQAYNQFQNTPFYQFPLQQANLATNRTLAASGLSQSGGALRAVGQLNAGYASQGLSQYLSGLGNLASGGQNAATSLGNIGLGTGSQIGQANTNTGNAQAIGTIGSANAINQGIGSLVPQLTGNSGSSSYNQGGLIGQAASGISSLIGNIQGYGSAAGQYLNPYGATANGMAPIVGNSGIAGGGV
jgi:hypothetical protein